MFPDILYCVSQCFTLCLPLNFFEIFCVLLSHIFHNICQYCFKCPLCWTVIFSLLPQGALQNSYCAAPPGSIVGHASSGQFLGSLLSDHSAQLLCVAIADVTVTILLLFHFDSLGRLQCEGYRIAQST